ncbi:two-component system regulatory protein YycI [Rossellomorea aquimaris]|uniref:two-component system regulatory protein YycI n=1 Tax=Rossellomorea aquimaris TaxID=189382 RepID=UPI001CD4A36F|nr:two-component system regulatory protein YycI [Rossellomorea aquimaris]MCA1054917.1 two-component system regulatory protein YycI [Rossellomorea aquimaris]
MDWSKTKTIFIVVFLILDIFLLSIFIKKISEPEILSGADNQQSLESLNISYPSEVTSSSKSTLIESYISAKTKKFTKEETKDMKKQEISILTENTLYSTLENPYPLGEQLSDEQLKDEMKDFIKEYVMDGDQYTYREYNGDEKTISYNQTYDGKTLFQNANAEIVFALNNENEIVSYKQTMMEDIKSFGEERKILSPLDALQILADSNKIASESKVTSFEAGYSTDVLSDYQVVMAPTWHFTVKKGEKKQDLFINAIDGNIIEGKKS